MFRSAVLLLICALLGACAGSTPFLPTEQPYVTGPVESITPRGAGSTLLVRAGLASREPCGILASVDASTRTYERPSGALRPIALADLAVGDTVEVYVEGAVAESCPAQGYAGTIVRIGR